jgi:hypothetical protein
MNLDEFEQELGDIQTDVQLSDFCQKTFLSGTPFVFSGREDAYYDFKNRMCTQFAIHHTEVFIVGSGMLGFSPHKKTPFSMDSDIDTAIVSERLWEEVSAIGAEFEYRLRSSDLSLHGEENKRYFKFLRYGAIGWIRPDLIPHKSPMKTFKDIWFNFFRSISYGNSEVGNYKVAAGIFRSHTHLENYTKHSLKEIQNKMEVKRQE